MRAVFVVPLLALLAACSQGMGYKLQPVALQFTPNSSEEYGYCAALLQRATQSPETLALLPSQAETFRPDPLIARAPSPSQARNTYNVTRIEGLPVLTSPVIVTPELIYASFQEAAMTCAGRYLVAAPVVPQT